MPHLPHRIASPSAFQPALLRQALLGIALLGTGRTGWAQIVTDGTLGAKQSLAGPNYQIPASLGKRFGPNLFHSFADFQLNDARESATFSGPANVRNIISRVTGIVDSKGNVFRKPSNINGQLNSTIAGANFFFINPAGIVFGPTGSVNVSGSFVATTADAIGLEGGGVFNALNPSATLLTSAPVGSFGFLKPQASPIILNGTQIEGAPGRSVSLIGGNITLQNGAGLGSLGGIDMVSVGAPDSGGLGLVGYYRRHVTTRDTGVSGFSSLGDISLLGGSQVVGAGAGVRVRGANLFLDGGSDLLALSDGSQPNLDQRLSVRLTGDVQLDNGSQLYGVNTGSAAGVPVLIRAANIFLVDGSNLFTINQGAGQGGQMTLDAGQIQLFNGSQIGSRAQSSGRGGDINIKANSFEAFGDIADPTLTALSTSSTSSGQAGNLTLQASNIGLTGGVILSNATGSGAGGALNITANALSIDGKNQNSSYIRSSTSKTGTGGNIQLKVSDLKMTRTGSISTNASGGGAGGSVTLQAKNIGMATGNIASNSSGTGAGGMLNITANNLSVDGQNTAQSAVLSSTTGAGRGGDIQVKADSVQLLRSGIIDTEASGSQQGGNVTVQAKNINVVRGGIVSDSTGAGDGGALNITADTIVLDAQNTAQRNIGSESDGRGRGGDVQIKTGDLQLVRGGSIISNVAGGAVGGSVNIAATGTVSLNSAVGSDNPSLIGALSGVTGAGILGTGDGGSIAVQAKNIQVSGSGLIFTNNLGTGKTNDINLQADSVVLDGGGTPALSSSPSGISSRLLATNTGLGGSIHIRTRDMQVKNGATISTDTVSVSNGGNIDISASTLGLSNRGNISASTSGDGNGGNVTIEAPDITLNGGNTGNDVSTQTGISAASTVNGGQGNAGNIDINTQNLQLLGHVRIDSSTASAGNGGAIKIKARNILMDSQGQNQNAINAGAGDVDNPSLPTGSSGNVAITTDSLQMKGDATIITSTLGHGRGGNVDITAKNVLIDGTGKSDDVNNISSETLGVNGSESGGNITISAGDVQLQNGATMSSSSGGDGKGGNITIQDATNVRLNSGAVIGAVTSGKGAGGTIDINAKEGILIDGTGTISNHPSGITASTSFSGFQDPLDPLYISGKGLGAGGTINLTAQNIGLNNNAVLATNSSNEVSGVNTATGQGGTINVTASEFFGMNNSVMTAQADGTGASGEINITACQALLNQSAISAISQKSEGGNITFSVGNLLSRNTPILAFALKNGGNVTINHKADCPELNYVILAGAGISASSIQGSGGNITITSQIFLPSGDAVLDATSQLGPQFNGTVAIDSPNTNVGGSLVVLPSNLLNAESYLAARCAVRGVGDSSSFNVLPLNGVPTQPGDLLPSATSADNSASALPNAPFSSTLRKMRKLKKQ